MINRSRIAAGAQPRVPKGLGEIKPDHARGRRDGLTQLRFRLYVYDRIRPGAIKDLWLIAYSMPKPVRGRPAYLDVRAFRFDPKTLLGLHPNERAEFDKLYSRRVDGRIRLASPTSHHRNRSRFGLTVEKVIKDWFRRKELWNRTIEPGTGSNRPGADIIWHELSTLYRELASELSDLHYHELARQLGAWSESIRVGNIPIARSSTSQIHQ